MSYFLTGRSALSGPNLGTGAARAGRAEINTTVPTHTAQTSSTGLTKGASSLTVPQSSLATPSISAGTVFAPTGKTTGPTSPTTLSERASAAPVTTAQLTSQLVSDRPQQTPEQRAQSEFNQRMNSWQATQMALNPMAQTPTYSGDTPGSPCFGGTKTAPYSGIVGESGFCYPLGTPLAQAAQKAAAAASSKGVVKNSTLDPVPDTSSTTITDPLVPVQASAGGIPTWMMIAGGAVALMLILKR